LDTGSRVCYVVGVNEEGGVVLDHEFTTSERDLIEVFEGMGGEVWVHLEAGELAGWIRGVLKERVAKVVVSHPQTNAWITKDPLKGDRRDALKLGRLLRMGDVHEVYYEDDEDRVAFKQVVRHYDDVTRQEARLKSKIKARLRVRGVIRTGQAVYSPRGREEALAEVSSPAAREAISQLYDLLEDTLRAQKRAKELMAREARKYEEIEILQEVPGVGLISACRFSAYIQNPHRFSSKRKLWRYCQLGVTDRSSDGKPLGYKQLDRNGNSQLKDVSCQVFKSAKKRKEANAIKRAYGRTLRATHNHVHARLSAQRKVVTIMWTLWKKGERYDDAKA